MKKEDRSSLKLDLKIQQKGNEVATNVINIIYNEKFKQYVHYHWIQHSLMLNSTPPWGDFVNFYTLIHYNLALGRLCTINIS